MYTVSQAYKDSIYAPSRMTRARVIFGLVDTKIYNDTATITATSDFALSNKNQLLNNINETTKKLITCENDRVKLDGSFVFADDIIANNGELGWCSNALCGSDKVFTTNQVLTFNFASPHSLVGLRLYFDTKNNEYATDFDVKAYNNSGTLIYTATVTGNTSVNPQVEGQFLNFTKLEIVVKKWSVANRRARILEVIWGIVQVYDDNSLVRLNLIEEMDLTSATLPSPELKFTVDNSNRAFNILNPTGLYKYLQERQQLTAEIGCETANGVEYVLLGNYLLKDWQSDEGSLTATFTATTNLDLMSGFNYENLTAKSNYSLYQMAVDIFALCGITNYQIDTALQSVTTNAIVEKANCKDVLQMIAIAGMCNIWITRNGDINIGKIYNDKLGIKVSEILLCGATAVSGASDYIDLDNMYQEPKIELDTIVKQVKVSYYTDIDTATVVTINNGTVTTGNVVNLENNTLINTSAQATNVANWLLKQLNYRSKYVVNWRGNPAHELNDVLSIENSYGTNMNAIIIKNEINYEGYLKAKTEAKGVVN